MFHPSSGSRLDLDMVSVPTVDSHNILDIYDILVSLTTLQVQMTVNRGLVEHSLYVVVGWGSHRSS